MMGYSTSFEGKLRLRDGTTARELAELNKILGERINDINIDLEIDEFFESLKWNNMEKTYDMDKAIELVVERMREGFPDFTLNGILKAQGEDPEDRYDLVVVDGNVQIQEFEFHTCPHCGQDLTGTI